MKDLSWRTAFDKVLHDEAFHVAKYPNDGEDQRGLTSFVYKFFDETLASSNGAIKNEIMSNQQLVEELQKPIIRKFEKCQVYLSFKDNLWDACLADM